LGFPSYDSALRIVRAANLGAPAGKNSQEAVGGNAFIIYNQGIDVLVEKEVIPEVHEKLIEL
jgi:hypothetical protein